MSMLPTPRAAVSGKMTSSTEPEVHRAFHCRPRRTELWRHLACMENLSKFRNVDFWDWRTDKHACTQYLALLVCTSEYRLAWLVLTAFAAQHLRPSGFCSCRSNYGLELSPGFIIISLIVYFMLQPIGWINTIVSLQHKIVQNCPAKSMNSQS